MKLTLLEKYDEKFFNRKRISELADKLIVEKYMLTLQILEAIICSYIHFRFEHFSKIITESIPLVIDIGTSNFKNLDENYLFEQAKYVIRSLGIFHASIKMENRKIYIVLY